MKNLFLTAMVMVVLGFSTFANANLTDNTGNLIYDTDLNITWYGVANNAYIDWADANTWAASLNYGGVSGWRLPTTPGGFIENAGEMGHLFFDELGGVHSTSITVTHNSNYALFTDLQGYLYWTGKEYDASQVWVYGFNDGYPGVQTKDALWYVLAVHDGNIAPSTGPNPGPVPEPSTMFLLGSGLIGLAGYGRRKFLKK